MIWIFKYTAALHKYSICLLKICNSIYVIETVIKHEKYISLRFIFSFYILEIHHPRGSWPNKRWDKNLSNLNPEFGE